MVLQIGVLGQNVANVSNDDGANNYLPQSLLDVEDTQDEISLISSVVSGFRKQLPFKAVTWELVKSVCKADETMQQLIE